MKQLFIGFALLLSAMSFAQTTITGTVTTTASGETVPFVNVILNNTTQFKVRVVEDWPGCIISNFYSFIYT